VNCEAAPARTAAVNDRPVEHFTDPRRFHETVAARWGETEIRNNLLLGTSAHLASSLEPALMLVAKASDGRCRLAAIKLRIHGLLLSDGDLAAAEILARAVRARTPTLSSAIGPVRISERFTRHWIELAGCVARSTTLMSLYALRQVEAPRKPAPGSLRLAGASDADWLTDWMVGFAAEAGLSLVERDRRNQRASLQRRIALGQQFVWDVGGRPVSIAMFAPAGLTGARISGVLTPHADRGKGYASSCVAAVSQYLLDKGMAWCSLFADIANPVSNGIYRRLGYREVSVYGTFEFAPRAAAQ
jgi:predicted GNAT family acetyltransferase